MAKSVKTAGQQLHGFLDRFKDHTKRVITMAVHPAPFVPHAHACCEELGGATGVSVSCGRKALMRRSRVVAAGLIVLQALNQLDDRIGSMWHATQ